MLRYERFSQFFYKAKNDVNSVFMPRTIFFNAVFLVYGRD